MNSLMPNHFTTKGKYVHMHWKTIATTITAFFFCYNILCEVMLPAFNFMN